MDVSLRAHVGVWSFVLELEGQISQCRNMRLTSVPCLKDVQFLYELRFARLDVMGRCACSARSVRLLIGV